MKDSLIPGLRHTMDYLVPENRTVPHLLPEAEDFRAMPDVLATGYLVGIVEWACMQLISEYLDEGEISLGTHVNFSHTAPTVPGSTVTVEATLVSVDRRVLTFDITVRDEHATISTGTHQRGVVVRRRFVDKLPS